MEYAGLHGPTMDCLRRRPPHSSHQLPLRRPRPSILELPYCMAISGRNLVALSVVFGAGYVGALLTPSGEGMDSNVVSPALGHWEVSTLDTSTHRKSEPAAASVEPAQPLQKECESVDEPAVVEAKVASLPEATFASARTLTRRPAVRARPSNVGEPPLSEAIRSRSEIIDPWASAEK